MPFYLNKSINSQNGVDVGDSEGDANFQMEEADGGKFSIAPELENQKHEAADKRSE